MGGIDTPLFIRNGELKVGYRFAGGTQVILNGFYKMASTASIYAPTSSGTDGQIVT